MNVHPMRSGRALKRDETSASGTSIQPILMMISRITKHSLWACGSVRNAPVRVWNGINCSWGNHGVGKNDSRQSRSAARSPTKGKKKKTESFIQSSFDETRITSKVFDCSFDLCDLSALFIRPTHYTVANASVLFAHWNVCWLLKIFRKNHKWISH